MLRSDVLLWMALEFGVNPLWLATGEGPTFVNSHVAQPDVRFALRDWLCAALIEGRKLPADLVREAVGDGAAVLARVEEWIAGDVQRQEQLRVALDVLDDDTLRLTRKNLTDADRREWLAELISESSRTR